jgi:O-antigen/teichoic acid export membrane protein
MKKIIGNMNPLIRGNIYLGIAFVFFYFSSYVIHFGAVRVLSSESYGNFGVLISLLTLLQITFMRGIPNSATKYLAEGVDGSDLRKKALLLQGGTMTGMVVMLYIAAPFLTHFFKDSSYLLFIKILACVAFIRGINQIFSGLFGGYRQFGYQAIHIIIDSFPRIVFVFIFLWLGLGVNGIFMGYGMASLVGIVFGLLLFKPKKTLDVISYSNLLKFSSPLIIYSICFQLMSSLDLFIIKSSNIPKSFVGYYTSAVVLCSVIGIITYIISMTLLPILSKAWNSHDKANSIQIMEKGLLYAIIVFIPVAVVLSSKAEQWLMLFFGKEYGRANICLIILSWGWFFLQLSSFIATFFTAIGKPRIPMIIAAFGVIISGILNKVLINIFGMEGGAGSTFLTGIICFGIGSYCAQRYLNIRIYYSKVLRIVLSAIMMCIIFKALSPNGMLLIGWSVLCVSTYFFILCWLKVVKKEEIFKLAHSEKDV